MIVGFGKEDVSASMITMGRMTQTPGMANIRTGNSVMKATCGDILMAIPTLTSMVPNPVGMDCMSSESNGSDHKHSNIFMTADGNSNKMVSAPVLNNNAFSNSVYNLSTLSGNQGKALQYQQGIGGISMGTTDQLMPTVRAHGISNGVIPTPGSYESKFVGIKKPSYVGMGDWNYCNISKQICGTMGAVNTQLKNPSHGSINCAVQLAGDNKHLMNHTSELSNSCYINASECDNLQLQDSSHQNLSQPRQQNLMQSDLMHSGNFHGPASCGSFHAAASFDGDSSRLVSTNLIHVPGLPSKQHQQKQQLSEEGRGVPLNQPALQPGVSNAEMKRQLVGRQHLLLYFYHASKCSTPECQCRNGVYVVKYKLWAHMTTCHERQCNYPCCSASRTLIGHHKRCRDKCCPVCGPVRTKLSSNRYTQLSNPGATEFINSVPVSSNFNSSVGFKINLVGNSRVSVLDTTQDEQPPIKSIIESASSNCSQQEVRSSQASAKIPCEMQGLTQTQTQPNEQESHTLKSYPLKPILATSACDRTPDKPTPTKRRKIGPTSSSCAQWKVERDPSEMEVFNQTQLFLQSRNGLSMMKSDILKTISVKPLPLMVEHPLRSQQVPFQQNCVLNKSTFWIPQADQGQIKEKQKKAEIGISFSANAPKQDVKETMQVEREIRSIPGFLGISNQKEGFNQTQTQVLLPNGHDSNMMKTKISKTIEVNHIHDKIEELQPLFKQKYIETALPTCSHKRVETKSILVSAESPYEMQGVSQMKTQKCQPKIHNLDIKNSSSLETIKAEPALVYTEQTEISQQGPFKKINELNKDTLQNPHAEHGLIQEQLVKQVQAVSLIEFFNCDQIREHITGLQQWVGQSKEKAENKKGEKICTLCNVGKLTFRLPPIYCSLCPSRIKPKTLYYFVASDDARHCICKGCYDKIQSNVVKLDGNAYAKSKLMKKKNEEVAKEEVWVQCDNCKEWQHSICALFNGKRNEEGMPKYTCPNCYIEQIERGVWKPLPQNAILRAKDLPTTCLSDHMEQRLCGRLRKEREERAEALGKSFEEVLGTEELAVRIVSSVDKVLEVKKQFSQFLQIKDFPSTFPYKSKVLLLFQTIEGVEICLFCMFVQEFGSECCHPNQRRIYLSYLDSVKYFRPDVKTVTGEALRTFVFHEILIGYLEYSKRRGFASCYIWSSPPSEGDDYILNCHPEIQKTPQTTKLRDWYLSMLHKARKEEIVVHVTNMYDYFFVSTGEQKAKVTAARLPYFNGDYFSDEAENVIISKLKEEEEHRQKYQNINKSTTKRSSRAAAQAECDSDSSKDSLLMKKLGDRIYQSKKNFIMVHLQHACSHCCFFIVCGKRWVCKECENFQLCDKCYELEQKLDERDSHPKNRKEKHILLPIEVTDVPADTKDKDGIMQCEFFDTRHAFLSLCRENHYQFDTLRRAKHSSMMVLYHLHKSRVPVFLRKCSACQLDIKSGQGSHSEICLDFDLCNDCYQKDHSLKHFRRLTAHPFIDDLNTKSREAHENQVQEVQKISIRHVFQCVSPQCVYQNCQTLKGIFRHGMKCKTGATQGCTHCRKMWHMLNLHARACKESECCVPRCMDLKQQWRSQNQMELRRSADVT
ncbi:histone acetyltransferase HAC12 isoform X2 [Cryptomeria japonica]|uniref:histone acetyltransferase HAC12 isoform X2 n=1 Tax=Cryptomeria japonica TaxID=3369 RepID=UPI0027DA0CDC|nr:histone acetyltransferase HAC12 isoform X2 [Cryptomeria japonica]